MSHRSPDVDAYIANSADFARPILSHLRELVHQACPEAEEAIKWRMPTFSHHGLLCFMAAFNHHAAFGFWKHKPIVGRTAQAGAMGQLGRLTSLKDLPSDKTLLAQLAKAIKRNAEAAAAPPRPRPRPVPNRALAVPDDFQAALKRNRKAESNFAAFSYSHKKEYVEWIAEAKREVTRQRRLTTALEWIAEGKSQNWKYERC